jgi:hypothetical protein
MGLLKWLQDRVSRQVLRLEVRMHYRLDEGRGSAALTWTLLESAMKAQREMLECALAVLLYARILTIHKPGSDDLFARVAITAHTFLSSSETTRLGFDDWALRLDPYGPPFVVWPWDRIETPYPPDLKQYTAMLRYGRPTRHAPLGFSIDLDMSFGMEKILAPAAALLAITNAAERCDASMSVPLAHLLLGVNEYYGSAAAAKLMSEGAAFAAAVAKAGKHGLPLF